VKRKQVVSSESDARGTVRVRGRLLTDAVQSVYVVGLDKFNKYSVTVQFVTDVATGPPSAPVTVRTLDDGMYYMYTVFHKNGTLFPAFIIYANDDQFTRNFYRM